MGNILIVEDDDNIRKLVTVNLSKRGYDVFESGDGNQAMSLFRQKTFDLVLLDLGLPGMSGVDVCIWIRARSDVPIIVLSGMRDEELKVTALDAGADDYITKPFGHEELLARVRAVLRRATPHTSELGREKVQIAGLTIDFETRRVRVGDEDISLTKTEYALLVELANHPDAVVDHNTLLGRVWGPQYRDANHYLHIYLGRVRKKLGVHGDLLETIPGVGYRLQFNKKADS
ncbi:MAG: response regulator transcription factor [Anaerolineales bacterium]|nr:response regulator transcription factor [Anaerolineales bacterium]